MDFRIDAFIPRIVLIAAIIIVMQELQNPRASSLGSVVMLQGFFVVVAGILYCRQLLDLQKIRRLNTLGLEQLSQDLFQDAEQSFQEAITIADRKRNKHVNYRSRQTFNHLGLLYERRGKYFLAKDAYERALKHEDSAWMKTLLYLGIPFGIYFAVLEEFLMLRDRDTRENSLIPIIFTIVFICLHFTTLMNTAGFLLIFLFLVFKVFRIQTANRIREIRTLLQIEELNLSMGQYFQVLNRYTEEPKKARAIDEARAIGNAFLESKALNNVGLAHFYQKQYPEALEYFKQADTIHSQVLYSQIDKPIEYGMTLLHLGDTYAASEQPNKALDYYNQAIAISEKNKRLSLVSLILFRQGTVEAPSRPVKALEYYNSALVHARKMGCRAVEARILHQQGLTLLRMHQFAEAELKLFSTIKIHETLRASELSDADKITLLETQTDTYTVLQEVLIHQYRIEVALEVAERSRARAFVELLFQRLSAENAQALTEFHASHLPTLLQIQKTAKAHNATLVQYSLISDSKLYIWVIQPSGAVQFRSVDLQSPHHQQIPLASLVSDARHSLGIEDAPIPERVIARVPEHLKLAAQDPLQRLSQVLIEPIVDLLPTSDTDLVIFIPHQQLFLVPFAALPLNGKPLIDSHTLQIAPSIQSLDFTHQRRQSQSEHPRHNHQLPHHQLIVGNPTMPHVTIEAGRPPIALNPLPGAKQEAEAIAQLLNVQAIAGAQATKAAVLQQMSHASLIHLATHGILNEIKGMGVPGAIALAPDGTGEPNDGLLTASEILELKLQADLVVLSCCNTGLGEITGDGVIGLSRCLFAAGVLSVIVSLWSVPDASTAFLMTEFYRHKLAGQDKAQALRQAMLAAKQRYSNPYHWAAFTLIGEAE